LFWLAAAVGLPASPAATEVRFKSAALPGEARYAVYLPPSYAASGKNYPVLYFLHDVYGDRDVLFREGAVENLDRAMRSGAVSEFVLVCPDGDGSWFSNYHDGSLHYEDLIARDLPADVARRFRTLPGAAAHGITGISMGGYGAVKIAMRHPDLYGSVSSLSGALMPIRWDDVERLFFLARWQMRRVFGNSPDDNSLAENDLWVMLARGVPGRVPFETFLLAGTEDKYHLDRVAVQYADFANRHGIRASAHLEPGVHDWSYWRTAFVRIAAWHAKKFESAEQNQ
jgi:S-formylglutathione hydrolase FrmB